MLQINYRNVFGFMPGCWQKPNDFSMRLGLPNTIGGFLCEAEVGDDKRHTIKRLTATFIQYHMQPEPEKGK